MAEDPGWVAALGGFWRMLLGPQYALRSKRGKATPILVSLRMMVISSIVQWLILLNVLLYVVNHGTNARVSRVLIGVLVAFVGLLDLIVVGRVRSRLPSTSDAVAFASEYRARFFLSFAVASSVVLVGFVTTFMVARPWPFAIALPFGALSLVLITPNRAAIEHDQKRMRAVHSKLNILDALMLPNGEVPQRIKKR